MALLSVEDALARILACVDVIADTDVCDLIDAGGRVLASPLTANLTQPPFDASAMDGYAVRAVDVANLPATLAVIGEAAAGHPFAGSMGAGEAVRIFTGAPIPSGGDAIVIQENTAAAANTVTVSESVCDPAHIRAAGTDFVAGTALIQANRVLTARDVSLAAAMGHATLTLRRKPRVAIVATGDELVPPGIRPAAGQIISSTPVGLVTLLRRYGADPHVLALANDTPAALAERLNERPARAADIIVTIGGASVGDHDLVVPALKADGFDIAFWKIAMRPGKPLFYGRRTHQHVVGLPGNPVSSMICTQLFVAPLVSALLGLATDTRASTQSARLTTDLEANGPRRHFMRATLSPGADHNGPDVTPAASQDSARLSLLAAANVLIDRAPNAAALEAGAMVKVLPLDD